MEVDTIAAEVKYNIKVPNLSTYTQEDELYSEFSLCLGGFRSQWGVNLHPFLSAKPNKPHHINSDIGITLSCVNSTITRPDIDIYCSVIGRGEEHEKKLELIEEQTWKGVLVPRLALHVFDLLPHDQLTATLRFVVRTNDIWKNIDPLEELSVEMGKLRKGKYSDVNILTTDGVTIPAHSVILHARSTLLWEKLQMTDGSLDILEDPVTPKTKDCHNIMQNRPETPFNTSSGYTSSTSLASNPSSRSAGHSVSSMKSDRMTPVRSVHRVSSPKHPHSPSRLTGDKKPYSPVKCSPSKRYIPRFQNSPSRSVLQHENQSTRQRQTSPLPPVSCDSVNSSTSGSTFSISPLKDMDANFHRSATDIHTVKVNMSASVVESMLDWIYTGVCSDLDSLAKPLLVGGQRHGVKGLVRACEQHLAATLTPATAPHILLLAHKYSANSLCSATMNYAVNQAKEVTGQPLWSTVASRAPALMTEFSRLLALHAYRGRR